MSWLIGLSITFVIWCALALAVGYFFGTIARRNDRNHRP